MTEGHLFTLQQKRNSAFPICHALDAALSNADIFLPSSDPESRGKERHWNKWGWKEKCKASCKGVVEDQARQGGGGQEG